MKCSEIEAAAAEYLHGELEKDVHREIEEHLHVCEGCRKEFGDLSAIWNNLALLPDAQPDESVRIRFHAMLDAYRQGVAQGNSPTPLLERLNAWLANWWPRRPVAQLGIVLGMLVVGVMGGRAWQSTDVTTAPGEFARMEKLLALSLLQQQSAAGRLQGVSWSARMQTPDASVVDALVQTLNYDQNVNVRLAAVEALARYADKPEVRSALLRSVAVENDPFVQVALIDLLVDLQEKQSVTTLSKLAEDDALHETVKTRAARGIELLRDNQK